MVAAGDTRFAWWTGVGTVTHRQSALWCKQCADQVETRGQAFDRQVQHTRWVVAAIGGVILGGLGLVALIAWALISLLAHRGAP